jgi:uncharacterized lipoprotein YehR (DUF1307 family)
MKTLLIILLAAVMALAGCGEGEEGPADLSSGADSQHESPDAQHITGTEVAVTVDGEEFTGEDLLYEMKRLELIALLQGEELSFNEVSAEVAIQELIQNELIRKLASEKGIAVNTIEQEERAEAVRAEVETVDGYEQVMEGIDESLFWSKEEARYQTILEAETIVSQLMDLAAEEFPTYDEQALRFEALEDFEELIQQQTAESEIEIN